MAAMAEGVGAFFLVYTGTATAVAAPTGASIAGDPPNSLAVALAFGLFLAAIVGALAPVSGAHLNPAVSVGLASIGRFPWRRVPLYAGAQLAGAVLGAGATWLTFGFAARNEAKRGRSIPPTGSATARHWW